MIETERELWREIIQMYKNMACLWDVKHNDYHNKEKRNEALAILTEKYCRFDNTANLETVKKKLHNMRSTYEKERKKVTQAMEAGVKYTPTVWHYELLQFLDGTNTPSKSTNNKFNFNFNRANNKIYLERHPRKRTMSDRNREKRIKVAREEKRQDITHTNIENLQRSEEEKSPIPRPTLSALIQKQEKFMEDAKKILAKKEKDWEIIGKSIGLQLEGLEYRQKAIAQKLISEAIYLANFGKLTEESSINIGPDYALSDQNTVGHGALKYENMLQEHLEESIDNTET